MPKHRKPKRRAAGRSKGSSADLTSILNLLGEAGILKSVRRSGWWMIGIRDGENVAEHSFRTGLLGYLLAKMEGLDPYPVVMMSLLNDLHEARINDLHKVGHRYIDFRAAEKKAAQEQSLDLPPPIRKDLEGWFAQLSSQKTAASHAARDADLLECMIQGKEYADQGRPRAIDWMKRPAHLLKTQSAKRLARRLRIRKSDRWWQHLATLAR